MKHFLIWIFLFFFAMSGFAQNLNIKGQITDTSGESIIGVNVKVKGKDTGTITDIDGNYHLLSNGYQQSFYFSQALPE